MQPKPLPGRGPLAGPAYQPPSAPPGVPQTPNSAGVRSSGPLPPGAEQRLQSSNQYLRTPVVRYSSRMRVGKLHPLRVTLTSSDGDSGRMQTSSGAFDPPIVVQVTAPGALVTPAHVVIPVSGGEAKFMVQPIKSGKMTGAKVEFLSQGRKVSEVAVPMRANRGYLARTLLWLGILLPFIINFFPSLTFVEHKAGARPGGIDPTIVDTGRIAVPGTPNMGGGGTPSKINPPAPNKTNDNDKNTPPKNEAEAPAKKLDLRPSGLSASPNRGGGTPSKGNRSTPEKSKENDTPKKDADTPKKDTAALVLASFIALQPPTKEKDDKHPIGDPSPIKKDGETPSKDGEKVSPGTGRTGYANTGTINYTEEEAIVAWVRSKLVQTGYQTRQVQKDPEADSGIFSFPRRYEITQESNSEWSTKRIAAVALYYCEPVLRFLYRFVIEFPKKIQFGDLILALAVLALGALVWLFTGPNRRKVKGAVMDIRLAGN